MERGFIRAEVISYGDLGSCGNLAEARKRRLLRTEGKNYIIQDGDVVTFLFNVKGLGAQCFCSCTDAGRSNDQERG